MANGLSSILGGLAQGFADFGKSAADMFGGAATNNALTVGLDALINKKSFGQASRDARQRELDYRKWLYDTNSDKDAAAKGLGTALNGAQTALDIIPGLGQSAPVNALQGALGGLSDEFKFNGENYDLGNAGKRAALGAGVGVATGGLGKALANSGNRVLSNGVLRGATTGALGGALSQAGNTTIEGGSADEILRSAAQGAQGGALLGAGTGAVQSLQGALAKSRAKNNAPAIMDEEVVMAELAPEQSAAADAMLSPEQREFFKDSVIRDENGKLIPVYHSSPNKFTAFDDARLGNNTAYDNTAFGHFVTNDRDFSSRFRDIDNRGIDGYTMELYANAKKPITHPYEAAYKYSGDELDNIVKNYYKETDNPEALAAIKEWADESGQSLYDAYMDMSVDENPFEMAAAERQTLQGKGYDAVEFVEGRKSGLVDGSNDDTPISSYAIFSGNQLKDINNLTPTDNVDIMAERAAPGQLGLFDQTATKAPETGYSQLGLFDQPIQPKTVDVADVNPYAPVNGEVTQTMRDRAADILGNYEKGLPENELYNRIRPETMPTEGVDVLSREAAGMKLKDRKEYITKNLLGGKSVDDATLDDLFDVYYAGNPERRKEMESRVAELDVRYRNAPNIRDTILRNTRDSFAKKIKRTINKAAEAPSQRGGNAGALDTIISERLGIAPGNTNKRQAKYDMEKSAWGRYRGDSKDLAVNPLQTDPEKALSTAAHERLHSFQNESGADSGRYDKEVNEAYKELRKELIPYLHTLSQIRKDHYGNYGYYSERIEQEARMLQDYLDAKGYTKSNRMTKPEYGEEINPAFDKFFDKLRDLSKRGIALPALAALFGGGAYMANQEEDENNNGQQI